MQPLTLNELIEKLSRLDETDLIEVLRLTSEQIARAFEYLIEDRIEELTALVDEYE